VSLKILSKIGRSRFKTFPEYERGTRCNSQIVDGCIGSCLACRQTRTNCFETGEILSPVQRNAVIEDIHFNDSVHIPYGNVRHRTASYGNTRQRNVLNNENCCQSRYEYSSMQTKSREKMDAEKLIECIRRRPVLYECSRKSYKDSAEKEQAWNEVAEEPGEGVKGLYSSIFTRIKCEQQITLFSYDHI